MLSKVLTLEFLSEWIDDAKRGMDSTDEIERQIKAETRRIEDLEIAIQRNLNTIEKTGSSAAQDRLKQREAERAQAKDTMERLSL